MKKLITCMLILALSLSAIGSGAFAADAGTVSMNFEEVGLAFELPEEFVKTKGILEPYPIGELASGITFMMFSYTAMTPDELKALEESEAITKEQEDALVNAMGNLAYVFSIDGGRNAGDILETLQIPTVTEADFTEIGKAEDVTFYLFLDKETDKAFLSGIAPEFAEEFTTLQSKLPEVLKAGTFSVPRPIGSELVGRVLRFETKDIDGNPVKSEDIFAKNEITMVNVWATWCGPCRSELEELGEIDRRLAAKNCAVVGICIDADEAKDEAKEMMKQYRMDYLNILPFDDLDEALAIQGYPTTVFVGRDGTILALPVVGVPNELSFYEETIDSLLAGEAPAGNDSPDDTTTTVASSNGKYNVHVRNSEGEAVEGVTIQFCSDETCTLGKTDADGLASFDAAEGQIYTIHVLKVPEGVEKTGEEFKTLDVYSDIYIVLQKTA